MSQSHSHRKRRSPTEIQRIISKFHASQVSRAEFCRREQLCYPVFLRWLKTQPAPIPLFKEISVDQPALNPWQIEVSMPNGMILRLADGAHLPLAAKLLRVARAC